MNNVHTGETTVQHGGNLGGENMANGNTSNKDDYEVDTLKNFSITTLNVNSLYISRNVSLIINEKSQRQEEMIKILKHEILVKEIINKSLVTILTDTRTSRSNIRDLKYL